MSAVNALMPHLVAAPILLPMATGAALLLLHEDRRRAKVVLNLASTALWCVVAVLLLRWVDARGLAGQPALAAYLPGNWPAPFGIVLVVDRLSALLLVTSGLLAFSAVLFAAARWHRAGVHFHPLFQFQLMGLAGAFLTADLFNLFVFFEIMLAASYGLLLHGSGRARVEAGLHYIAINLAASSLFLVGAAMLYGVTGTLNMADLAQRIPDVPAADRGLLHAAAAVLAVAFLAKAAAWPLNSWLVPAYSAATPPVSALFVMLSKVGFYALLRMWTLLFSVEAGPSAFFGGDWIMALGLVTLAFGAVGVVASQKLAVLGGYSIIVSAGTLLAVLGYGQRGLLAGALYYMVSSMLACAAFFLVVDLVERWRNDGHSIAPHERGDHAPFLSPDLKPLPGVNLDAEQRALIGTPIPGAVALLGLAFLACTLLLSGLPPLSGFVGKVAMLSALLNPGGVATAAPPPGAAQWLLMGLLVASGLLSLVALSRNGIRHFWAADGRITPTVRVAEAVPVALLLGACVALTLFGGAAMRYANDTAAALVRPRAYMRAVLGTQPRPYPSQQAPAAPGARPVAPPTFNPTLNPALNPSSNPALNPAPSTGRRAP